VRLPLIIDCSSDLYVADSVASTESEMEPIDVRNGEYNVYDADGRFLRPDVVLERRREKTVVKDSEPEDLRPEELRQKIIHYLRTLAMHGTKIVEAVLTRESLPGLIARLRNVAAV
jgi:hypothetical protein